MKSSIWRTDWLLGLAVVVLFAVFSRASGLIPSLERKAYDLGVAATSRTPSDRIAVIAIDEASLENIGRWPWPRDVLARMTEKLAAANAKVIGNTVLLSEPQIDPGYVYIAKLLELAPPGQASPFTDLLKEAEAKLNTDRQLAASFSAAGNVLQPMLFTLGEPQGKPDRPLPGYVTRNALTRIGGAGEPLPARAVMVPIEPIARSVAAIGHLNQVRDVDGAVRSEPLVVRYYDQFYPSLSVMIAARYLNLAPRDIKVTLGEGLQLERLRIGTDPDLLMYTYFYQRDRDGRPAFPVDSFFDVSNGKIPLEKYRDRIVLIGSTAAGLGDAPATPGYAAMPPVLTLAHAVSSILQEHFFVTPLWAYVAELAIMLLIAGYIIALLPRLQAGPALVVSGAMFATLIVAHFALMVGAGTWVQLMAPATLLLAGHAALVSKRFIVTERAKQKSDESSAESNRMLALAYQGQGQLDLAWDKFRQVPMSESLLDNLYNLALDFERKRQFNKAEAVFRSLHEFSPKFRDVGEKVSRAKQLSETVILGGSSHPGGTLQLNLGAKPKFGRFEVEKELGKGAMGVVYLGQDPKIGREVAIKTLALAQEFEPEELAGAKERFFREAQTAGRLSHPNIVTIYDTGEEHDFCYIAMELLKGGDLVPHTKPANLLAPETVVSVVARAADALGYAHREGVVHRDVKPANLMYHAPSDTLKVTDFGIARLTASSKTKTGMVLGTPSFMSPEQLAGKRIDGRSDLFSLAASLYQLLCGRLPFEGESMAQLMFKIANDPAPDIRTLNPGVPDALAAFLERALAKNPDERFQTGEEFGGALRAAVAVKSTGSVDIEL